MEDKITDEERKQAGKILAGLTFVGDKEEMIKSIVKKQIRKRSLYTS
jgi:K+/H+ antiporter YhaU regulatory subunit KhtT